jgi:hypothetical protein
MWGTPRSCRRPQSQCGTGLRLTLFESDKPAGAIRKPPSTRDLGPVLVAVLGSGAPSISTTATPVGDTTPSIESKSTPPLRRSRSSTASRQGRKLWRRTRRRESVRLGFITVDSIAGRRTGGGCRGRQPSWPTCPDGRSVSTGPCPCRESSNRPGWKRLQSIEISRIRPGRLPGRRGSRTGWRRSTDRSRSPRRAQIPRPRPRRTESLSAPQPRAASLPIRTPT